MNLSVREISLSDIDSLCNYWLLSSSEHLVGMGVDLNKLPTRDNLSLMLKQQIYKPIKDKNSYALIWEIDNTAIGHTNINQIEFGKRASMHLHLWNTKNRKKGIGSTLVKKSLPFFFKNYQLEYLDCEPYARNPAPNKILENIGFQFIKKHTTIPGSLNFEQEVNLWRLTRERFQKL